MSSNVLNVRLPSIVVKWLDSLVKGGIYKSRSEAIREFARDWLNQIEHKRPTKKND